MVLEATLICLDNSEWMRNGDFSPSRLMSQHDSVHTIISHKFRDNPENAVGIMSMGEKANVLMTLSTDAGAIMGKIHNLEVFLFNYRGFTF